VVPHDRDEIKKLIDDRPIPIQQSRLDGFSVKNNSLAKQWTIDALSMGFSMSEIEWGMNY